MPWSAGTYTRTNGVYSGPSVWNSDFTAGVKIVYSRHDVHDQDLAQGINACINKNGANSPTSNINWGGFKVTNHANASANTDVMVWGQSLLTQVLDPGTFILTFSDRTGTPIGTVDLSPLSAGGGSGAPSNATYVTLGTNGGLSNERVLTGTAGRISITDGGANNPVTLDLIATGATPGTYTNPVVTADAYGRITSISTGPVGTITSIIANAPLSVQNLGSGQRRIILSTAAYVNPATATAQQIAQSLIDCGLMEPA